MNTNRKYWMHRITFERNLKQILLDKEGLLITGWGGIADVAFLSAVKGKNHHDFSEIYEKRVGEKKRNRFCLYWFLNEFKKGDYVIAPSGKTFSVYEIVEDHPHPKADLLSYLLPNYSKFVEVRGNDFYEPGTNRILDSGFFWKVRPVETGISKNGYASNGVQKRLKFQMTNIEMTDLGADIEEAIKRQKEKSPILVKEEILNDISGTIVEKLTERINDHEFEKVVKWYLEEMGADIAMIPSKNNLTAISGDADVIALFNNLRVVVFAQVKQYQNSVGKSAIEQVVKAYQSYKDDFEEYTPILWVVTTCNTFIQDALDYAAANHVRCITGDEFARMMLDVGLKNLNV